MVCSKCHGTGFLIELSSEGESIAKPCECRKEKDQLITIQTRLIDARIPPLYWPYEMEQYKKLPISPKAKEFNQPAIEYMKAFIDDPTPMVNYKSTVLWIWGEEANACHTTLATILGKSLLHKDIRVRFISMLDLTNAFVEFDKKTDFFNTLNQYRVFILDNAFDTTRCSATKDYTIVHLYNWLDTILGNEKILICTSNIPIAKIDNIYLQSKIALSRHYKELEIKGSITTALGKF